MTKKTCFFCRHTVHASVFQGEFIVISFNDGREDEIAHPECLEGARQAYVGMALQSMNGGVHQ